MLVIYNDKKQLKPIKVWLDDLSQLDTKCLEQAINLANLPFIHGWVALMPDTHSGFGMPIGGVIGCEDIVIPNAVGVDIGCGISYVKTNIMASDFKKMKAKDGQLIDKVTQQILRDIPTGFQHHKTKQASKVLDAFEITSLDGDINKDLIPQIAKGYFQLGTLGGGNHFIELQEDQDGILTIMVHTGSRNLGKQICDFFNSLAKKQKNVNGYSIPVSYDLAGLSTNSHEGKQYVKWMNLALNFAQENRISILEKVKDILVKHIQDYTVVFTDQFDCHHNFAAYEKHFGKNLWIHRKGAIKAFKGQLGIVPGSMGSYSYIVEGLGNEESFCSSPHGAGRVMGRNDAKKRFTAEEVLMDLNKQKVVLGTRNTRDIAEEARFVYKDIENVICQGKNLFNPVKRMKTVAVIKG